MAITTLDGYIGAVKQRLTWMKTGTKTLVAAMPYTVFDVAGNLIGRASCRERV